MSYCLILFCKLRNFYFYDFDSFHFPQVIFAWYDGWIPKYSSIWKLYFSSFLVLNDFNFCIFSFFSYLRAKFMFIYQICLINNPLSWIVIQLFTFINPSAASNTVKTKFTVKSIIIPLAPMGVCASLTLRSAPHRHQRNFLAHMSEGGRVSGCTLV